MTPLEVLAQANEHGLFLSARGEGLAVHPDHLLTQALENMLLEFKPALLPLLRTKGITWIEVYSERVGETIFFCSDEETRGALIEAGASPWSIYTKQELRQLEAQNRIAPISADELRRVHEIKRTFLGRISE
jgi:hypothetical protein